MIETDRWPKIQAKWYRPLPAGERRKVRLIVIHDMEFGERGDAAEIIARDFATRSADSKASAHVCIDNNSIIQCVGDNDVAYAAPGANNDGIHLELTGFGRQTREEWLDEFGRKLLDLAGNVVGQYALKYTIPILHLTDNALRNGAPGVVGHDQVSRVYRQSDHTDPGPNFPWDVLLQKAVYHYGARRVAHA